VPLSDPGINQTYLIYLILYILLILSNETSAVKFLLLLAVRCQLPAGKLSEVNSDLYLVEITSRKAS